jgi:hypothetical protein
MDKGKVDAPLTVLVGGGWWAVEIRKKIAAAFTDVTETENEKEALGLVRAGSMMAWIDGSKRLVVLKWGKKKWHHGEGWDNCLLVVAEEWSGPGVVIECGALNWNRTVEWVARRIGNAPAERLLEKIGNHPALLMSECDKLLASCERVRVEDVDSLCGDRRESESWEVVRALCQGGLAGGIKFVQDYLARGGEPLMVMHKIGTFSKRLVRAARLKKAGKSLQESLGGFREDEVEGAVVLMRAMGMRRINQVFDILVETDEALKGSRGAVSGEVVVMMALGRLFGERVPG